jgi:hypothetical protein
VWGGLTEEERERIYVRAALSQYGREKGAGLRAAGDLVGRSTIAT